MLSPCTDWAHSVEYRKGDFPGHCYFFAFLNSLEIFFYIFSIFSVFEGLLKFLILTVGDNSPFGFSVFFNNPLMLGFVPQPNLAAYVHFSG